MIEGGGLCSDEDFKWLGSGLGEVLDVADVGQNGASLLANDDGSHGRECTVSQPPRVPSV